MHAYKRVGWFMGSRKLVQGHTYGMDCLDFGAVFARGRAAPRTVAYRSSPPPGGPYKKQSIFNLWREFSQMARFLLEAFRFLPSSFQSAAAPSWHMYTALWCGIFLGFTSHHFSCVSSSSTKKMLKSFTPCPFPGHCFLHPGRG